MKIELDARGDIMRIERDDVLLERLSESTEDSDQEYRLTIGDRSFLLESSGHFGYGSSLDVREDP